MDLVVMTSLWIMKRTPTHPRVSLSHWSFNRTLKVLHWVKSCSVAVVISHDQGNLQKEFVWNLRFQRVKSLSQRGEHGSRQGVAVGVGSWGLLILNCRHKAQRAAKQVWGFYSQSGPHTTWFPPPPRTVLPIGNQIFKCLRLQGTFVTETTISILLHS